MLPYIFHVSLLITTCYLLYRLLWEKETYFQLNRWILITCLLLSFGLPLLTVPEGWSLQQRVVQQEISGEEGVYYPELGANPLEEVIVEVPINELVAAEFVDEGRTPSTLVDEGKKEEIPTNNAWREWAASLDFWQIIQYVYLGGIIIFLLNFLIQLALIFFQKATNPKLQDGRFTIVEINQDKAPFSFGSSIFINPTKYDWDTYNQILDHEKIHIEQRHTLDILIAELVVIAQWFNPFAWLYRKAVENNLEYLTDFNMLDRGTEPEIYQLNLLRVSVPQLPLNLTTNYNQSFLKKRIAMMNVKKSSASSSWKYLLLFPLLALTVITLNPVQLQAQNVKPLEEKAKKDKEKQEKTSFWDRWNTPPTPPSPAAPPAPPSPPAPPNFSVPPGPPAPPSPPAPPAGVTSKTTMIGDWSVNTNSRTTVNGEVMMEDNVGIHISGSSSFDEDNIVVHRGTVSIDGEIYSFATRGDWSGKFNGNQLCLQLATEDRRKDYSFSISFCDRDFGPTVYPNAKSPFKLTRSAGTQTLDGNFNGKRGNGAYTFTEDANYRNYLTSEGYDYVSDNLMLHLYISEVNKSYFTFLKEAGYGHLPKEELEHLVHHRVREEKLRKYLKSFRKLNLDKPKMSELVQLVIHDISPEYIQEMGGDLFEDLTIQQIVEASVHGVEPEFIKEIYQLGYKDMEFRDIIEFAVHGVETDYVKVLTDADLGINKQQIIEAAVHGIDTDFIVEVTKAGFDNLDFQDIIQFGVHGIDAGYIRDLQEVDLDNLSPDKIVEAAIHGINPRTIKAFQELGIGKNSLGEIIELRVHGVDADYVEIFQNLGYKNLSAGKMVEAKVHGVDPDDIIEFHDLGLKDIPFNKLVEMQVHGVSPSFIERVQRKNNSKDFSLNDYIDMKIHGRSTPSRRQE